MLIPKAIRKIKEHYLPGMKIELIHMEGEDMPKGLVGEVKHVDAIGQIHMSWENGSSLPLNVEVDEFSIKI